MPFALVFIAIILIVTGYKGTIGTLASNLGSDAKGAVVPFVAILAIGGLGYIPGLKKISDAFLVLVLLAMFLADKGGFFSQFNNAIRTPANSDPISQGNVTVGMPQVLQPLQGIGN